LTATLVAPDSLRAALDSVFRSPAYEWRNPDVALSWLRERWLALLAWLGTLRDANPIIYRILIAVLVVMLLAILLHAAWVLYRTARRADDGAGATAEAMALPARGAAWFSAEADRLAREGRYADAVQAAFVALARRLDELGLLQYHASRTPAECVRDARLLEDDRSRLRRLVTELYRAAFGAGAFGAEEYQRWRAEADGAWHAPAH
jgi:hypothetical protein